MRQAEGKKLRLRHPPHRHPSRHDARGRPARTTRSTKSSGRFSRRFAPTTTASTRRSTSSSSTTIAPTTSRSSASGGGRATTIFSSGDGDSSPRSAKSNCLRLPASRRVARRNLRQDRPEVWRPQLLGDLGQGCRQDRRDPHYAHQGPARRPESKHRKAFDEFLAGLQDNLNAAVSAETMRSRCSRNTSSPSPSSTPSSPTTPSPSTTPSA